jgi:DNA processing protein
VIERDDLAAWLRLLETPGVGRTAARRLLAAFGSCAGVFDAHPGAWRDVVPAAVAQALGTPPDGWPALLEATWAWLQAAPTPADDAEAPRAVVCLGDDAYPSAWLHTADPPLLVYAQGRLDLLKQPSVAVVGSRSPTRQGLDNARAFAEALSLSGLTVVSGLALGVDGAAHEGALAGPGRTVAFVGTGLDRVYPRQHRALAHQVARAGLLVSEHTLGTPPLAAHFPQRNRLIAGLSQGTLVVEAALKSGSLITARLAMEAGREVFAIPGSIHAPQSRGCHALIKQGAKLVECAQDILEELNWQAGPALPMAPPRSAEEERPELPADDPLLAALGHDPVTLDNLSARTGCSPQVLNVRLLTLELEGVVARLPGQLFQRVGRA